MTLTQHHHLTVVLFAAIVFVLAVLLSGGLAL
jgi:hypothetical protein